MLSVVNTTEDKKVAEIKIDGDTLEAMALAPSGPMLYIDNPSKNHVDVVNRQTRSVVKTWPVTMGKKMLPWRSILPRNDSSLPAVAGISSSLILRVGKKCNHFPSEQAWMT